MSASLVGSEMCIRDRPGPGRLAQAKSNPTEATPSRATDIPRVRVAGSVSYTHLTLPTICSV
eukprot:8948680-Alexandrium_andersonii.AAC.1